MIINFIRGFCMALADSVPGVSGGTIAFLMGFYDQFINSLDNIISGSKQERKDAILFFIKLGIGWVIGFGLAVLVLTRVFESSIYQVSSLFIGFILFAIPIIIMEEKDCMKGKYINLIFTVIGAVVVFSISYFAGDSILGDGVDLAVAKLDIKMCFYLFVVAMVAISAMVLPGISGSTLLLIFGLYMPVISAVKEVLHINLTYVPAVGIFGIGVITGALSVVKIIKRTLEKYRSQTIYLIVGLMIGSLYAIMQGPTTLDTPRPAMDLDSFSILFFIIGGAVIIGLQFLKKFTEHNFR